MTDATGKDADKEPRGAIQIGDTVTLLHVKPSKKAVYKGIVTWISSSGRWLSIDKQSKAIIRVTRISILKRKEE